MAAWSEDEFRGIAGADLLYIAGRRPDGSLHKLVPIWVVGLEGRLFVRSVNGRDAAWFRGTQPTRGGHVRAGGVEKDVTFADVPDNLLGDLDAAYAKKYAYSPSSVAHINAPHARAAALELVPSP